MEHEKAQCPFCGSLNVTQTAEINPDTDEILSYYDDFTCQSCAESFTYPNWIKLDDNSTN